MTGRISNQQLTARTALDMVRRQADVAATQEQISSGKRVVTPSDDPAQAGRIAELEQTMSRLDQFDRNASSVEGRLSLTETSLTGVMDTVNRLRELALQANNSSLGEASHEAILAESKLHLDALYDFANTRDADGRYLYAGTNTDTQPFSRASPNVQYEGSDIQHRLPIGTGRLTNSAVTGRDIFMSIMDGNGDFRTTLDAANTGTGVILENSVTDRDLVGAATPPDSFSIEFTTATTFDIINTSTSTTVQSGVEYQPDQSINFEGRSVRINGTPAAGDQFYIKPSENRDVFNMVEDFNTALGMTAISTAEQAVQRQGFNTAISDLDNILDHINTSRSRVGSRLKSVETSLEENASIRVQLSKTLSNIEDLDMADAIITLESQATSLEALQRSYLRIQNLSLFQYL